MGGFGGLFFCCGTPATNFAGAITRIKITHSKMICALIFIVYICMSYFSFYICERALLVYLWLGNVHICGRFVYTCMGVFTPPPPPEHSTNVI